MNNVTLIGRLTRDPDVRYSQQGEYSTAVARFTLAVDRPVKKDAEKVSDFISCIAFGKRGEFVEKYLHKGTKIAISGRIQTGSYTNREGVKVYTTDVVAEHLEFAESAKSGSNGSTQQTTSQQQPQQQQPQRNNGFMDIPDGVDEELPFV